MLSRVHPGFELRPGQIRMSQAVAEAIELSDVDLHRTLADWGKQTSTGDRGELGDLPDNFRAWERINARADTCLGQRCPDFEPCFLTQMRRNAAEAQVVVVNHHLLMADL